MEPLECYKTYISIKNHFSNPNYDFHKYNGKVKASLQSFYKRKDRYFFEKLSRKKTDKEIIDFFVSNFVCDDGSNSLWVGELIKDGEKNYQAWKEKILSLKEVFSSEIDIIFKTHNLDEVFKVEKNKHPLILKFYLQKKVSIETLVILNFILDYQKKFDKKLTFDPIWESISLIIQKYSSFLKFNIFEFKKILKSRIFDKDDEL